MNTNQRSQTLSLLPTALTWRLSKIFNFPSFKSLLFKSSGGRGQMPNTVVVDFIVEVKSGFFTDKALLHHSIQASFEAITEIISLVFVIWLQSLTCISCSLQPSKSNTCREYTRLLSEAYVTQSYICKLTFICCAERPLSLAAQFQRCGDNRFFTYRCTPWCQITCTNTLFFVMVVTFGNIYKTAITHF
jgi:hypothetical protein